MTADYQNQALNLPRVWVYGGEVIEEAFKLKGLGLVHLTENQATVSCELYREYFCYYYF